MWIQFSTLKSFDIVNCKTEQDIIKNFEAAQKTFWVKNSLQRLNLYNYKIKKNNLNGDQRVILFIMRPNTLKTVKNYVNTYEHTQTFSKLLFCILLEILKNFRKVVIIAKKYKLRSAFLQKTLNLQT